MYTGKQLVEKIQQDNQPLFEASQMNITHWFKDPSRTKEDYLLHFQGRLANEYMNMVGIAEAIAKLPTETSAEEMLLLTKQAQDEAVHFRLVKEVIEHIEGKEVDTQVYLDREFARKANDKGAATLKTYDVENDPVALAVYQLVAEGRAATSWACMAKIGAYDSFVADKYKKIAADEKFHSNIGALRLEKLQDADPTVAERAIEMAKHMRKELYEIITGNTCDTPAARELAATAYGWK
jgi:ribonucleotide reductase beta subunit family protein with ferritin-like domain